MGTENGNSTWELPLFQMTCMRACVHAKSTLCDPMDYSLRGSAVPGILQARMLEWVTIVPSRGSS